MLSQSRHDGLGYLALVSKIVVKGKCKILIHLKNGKHEK